MVGIKGVIVREFTYQALTLFFRLASPALDKMKQQVRSNEMKVPAKLSSRGEIGQEGKGPDYPRVAPLVRGGTLG